MSDIQTKVLTIISDHIDGTVTQFDLDKNIFDDFGCDQLDEIEILMDLEDQLEIELPDINYELVRDFLREVNYVITKGQTNG